MFSHAEKIVLVQDNPDTHKPASLYQAFETKEARRLTEYFEWHYTPKHGSCSTWPRANSASSPRNVSTAASAHRKLRGEVAAWVVDRNKNQAKADWQFTTDDA